MKHQKIKIWLSKWSLDDVEGYLMVFITTMLVIDVFLGILARFVHFEHVFATELGKYLFIWLCMLGISAAAKDNQHIRIPFIVEKLPINPKITWVFSQVISIAMPIGFFLTSLRLIKDIISHARESAINRWNINQIPANELEDQGISNE
jgi:TRAP-type C4-dicarboxylate transport system permease small subunit